MLFSCFLLLNEIFASAPRRGWRSEARCRWRRRAEPVRTSLWSARRAGPGEFGHLFGRASERAHVDHPAERGIERITADRDRLPRAQPALEALCFRRRKTKHGAVLEQHAVRLAALAVQGRGDPAAEGLLI